MLCVRWPNGPGLEEGGRSGFERDKKDECFGILGRCVECGMVCVRWANGPGLAEEDKSGFERSGGDELRCNGSCGEERRSGGSGCG